MKTNLLVLITAIAFALNATATDYTVSSASQFNALNLQPCDVVTWTNGTYANQVLVFNGAGMSGSPITLRAQTPGGVIFTGTSTIKLYGEFLVIDGFYWNGGVGTNNHIEFRRGGSSTDFANNSIISNCAFNDLVTAGDNKSRWIVLYGVNNIVENCSFMNKNSTGACVLVELAFQGTGTVGHTLRNNYFYNFSDKDGRTNAGDSEAIRIGESAFQTINAGVLVEKNYFKETDGENEIITNKSRGNIYRNNTFRKSRGSLVLRHGAQALVEGNYFMGENKAKSGGIRVTDRDHVIINNYMQDLSNTGDTFNNGITLMGGSTASGGTSNGYQNVNNVLIAFNTIYNSDDPIFYNNQNGSSTPEVTFANNLIYSTNGTIVSGSISSIGGQTTYVNNIFGGSTIGVTNAGITNANANFAAAGLIFKPSTIGPAANAATGTYNQVSMDIEGFTRPSSGKDVGAHEIVGAMGTATNPLPILDAEVGNGTGACFLDATGASITATCGPRSTSCAPILVTGITVNPGTAIVGATNTIPLVATIAPTNATNQQVTWLSSNTAIATVNATGTVTGVAAGNAVITATTVDGSFTATATITVTAPLTAPDCVQGTNLALNNAVINITDEQATNPGSNLVDGDTNTRWSGMNFPQSAVIDLGEGFNINAINFYTYQNRDYQYFIEGSQTSSTSGFTMLVDRQSNTSTATTLTDTFNPTVVRYVRLTVTGAATYTGPWVSVQELEVVCAGAVLSVEEPLIQALVKVYPNPFNDELAIVIPDVLLQQVASYRITDLQGRLVLEDKITIATSTITLDKPLSNGTYLLQLVGTNSEVFQVQKILKK